MTVGTSHASRRGDCTQQIGAHAWLVPTVMDSGVGACGRASSAVRAAPRDPRHSDLSSCFFKYSRSYPAVLRKEWLRGRRIQTWGPWLPVHQSSVR